jgi:MFS family permease
MPGGLPLLQRLWHIFRETFSPLTNANLGIYLGGQAVSLLGTWMQITAQSWVVWQLSQRETALGIVAMFSSVPFLLLGPIAGVWADRLDRRKVLVFTQAVAMVLAFGLAALVQWKLVRLWHVYALAFGLGVVNTLDMPAQQAFLGDLSGMGLVRRAVILNGMIVQVSRMLGPTLAGWVIAALGVAPAFWLNGASFVAVIASLLAVRAQQVHGRTAQSTGQFREGLQFLVGQPRIQDLMILTAFATFFGFSNSQIMPAIATEVLHKGPEALGTLMGASGAGALASVLLALPILQKLRRAGRMLAGSLIWSGVWFVLFASARQMPTALAAMFCSGIGIPVVLTTANGLLQVLVPGNMRARLLSIWIMVSFGFQPIAALMVGYSASLFGPANAVLINGALMALGALLLLLFRTGLWHWVPHVQHHGGGGLPAGREPGAKPEPGPVG